MSYVDGFVIVIKKSKVEDYKKMAMQGKEMWLKHGALDYKECVGDDLTPKMPDMPGMENMPKANTFVNLAKPQADETIVFSYIVFRDRAHRDEVNAKVMSDPAMTPEAMKDQPMPFEMNKMTYGGFQTIVE
jgi:uncharacterized protein YbaA (DUF1428 family)